MSSTTILRLVLLGALVASTSACVSWVTPPGTSISSTPAGARVLVDGKGAGYLTPCMVDLDTGRSHRVRLELTGHYPQELVLDESGDVYLIPWSLGYDAPIGWSFPLFLSYYDLFHPIRIDNGLSPDRMHVMLEPLGASQ